MKRLFPLTAVCMATALAADIPIREVILYKSGVGYFERAGMLHPGESARLEFKASDMNDVLKSLTLADRNGGKVAGLGFVVELTFLNGRKKLDGYDVFSLMQYDK